MCLPGYTFTFNNIINPNENFSIFRIFLWLTSLHVFNHLMVGLMINPV